MATVFFSYAHADEGLRDELEKQLSMLRRQGVIDVWHDRRIDAGQELHAEISSHVDDDDIILLLVSPDFLASDYCYELEMTRAMERHQRGDAVVIPVILRPCDWHSAPFGGIMATPTDARPVTQWPDRDVAFLEVAQAVRRAAERFPGHGGTPITSPSTTASGVDAAESAAPRSSNLRVAKTFSDREKDDFRHATFDYMAKFFENSIAELARRNPDVDGTYRRVDGNRFTVALYRAGAAASQCTIFLGGGLVESGICYFNGITVESNTYNESLSVDVDGQKLFLRSMGMASFGRGDASEKLSMAGASELYWSLLVEPLQRDRNPGWQAGFRRRASEGPASRTKKSR